MSQDPFEETAKHVFFKLRRGTSLLWSLRNTILRAGEPGLEEDTDKFKIGDGLTPWNDLPYYITEDATSALVMEMVAALPAIPGNVPEVEFQAHVVSEEPHPNYDDGTSFVLRYQNAKV